MGIDTTGMALLERTMEQWRWDEQTRPIVVGGQHPQPVLIPAVIDVHFWQLPNGKWAAVSPQLGLGATASGFEQLVDSVKERTERLWEVLNQKFDALDESKRNLLSYRLCAWSFHPVEAPSAIAQYQGYLVELAGEEPDDLVRDMRGG